MSRQAKCVHRVSIPPSAMHTHRIEGFFWVLLGTVTAVLPTCTNTTPAPASRAAIGTGSPTAPVAPIDPRQRTTDAGNATSVPATATSSSVLANTVNNPPTQTNANIHCPELVEAAQPGTSCGPLHCLAFSNERSALAHVLSLNPQVMGIGESHAQAGSQAVHSATRRFAEQLLPVLRSEERRVGKE